MKKLKVITFFYYFIVFSLGVSPSVAEKKSAPTINLKKLSNFKIPQNLGSLDEVWIPNQSYGMNVSTQDGQSQKNLENTQNRAKGISPKIVLHIRDAHCIYEAQLRIAQIIEDLVKRYKISLVCMEGAEGPLDPSPLIKLTSPSVRREVLQGMMRRGKLSGPEYAASASALPIKLYGIENSDLYEKNVEAFQKLIPYRERTTQVFDLLVQQLLDLEPSVFSQDLREFAKLVQVYEDAGLSPSQYGLEVLKSYRKYVGATDEKGFRETYPNVSLFIQKDELESGLNFDRVEQERTLFFSDVAEKIETEKMNTLVSKSLEFRLGRISTLEYYEYLGNLMRQIFAQEMDKPDFKYVNLVKFIEYEKLFSRIQGKALFDEWDKIRDLLFSKLAKNSEEKSFLNYSRTVKVFRRLYRSELTQAEFADFISRKEEFNLRGIIEFLKENTQKYQVRLRDGFRLVNEERLKSLMPAADDFYIFADQRNEALTNNLLKALEVEKADVVILVAGGFHTESIKKYLKQNGLAYAVITPLIQEEVIRNPYVEVMSGKKSELEKFLIEYKIKPEGGVKGTQEGGISK